MRRDWKRRRSAGLVQRIRAGLCRRGIYHAPSCRPGGMSFFQQQVFRKYDQVRETVEEASGSGAFNVGRRPDVSFGGATGGYATLD